MPDGEDWLSTEQAAALTNRVLGVSKESFYRPVSGQTMRKLCRTGEMEDRGIPVMKLSERYYYMQKRSLLIQLRDISKAALERAEKELAQ